LDRRLLSLLWAFLAGVAAMASIWIYAAHARLTCEQMTVVILLIALAVICLAIATAVWIGRIK